MNPPEAVALRALTERVRDMERELAPGSETAMWQEYLSAMRTLGVDALAAVRDQDGTPHVPALEAAWWLGAYHAAYWIRESGDLDGLRRAVLDGYVPSWSDLYWIREALGVEQGGHLGALQEAVRDGAEWAVEAARVGPP
jgi:hypothetical protein